MRKRGSRIVTLLAGIILASSCGNMLTDALDDSGYEFFVQAIDRAGTNPMLYTYKIDNAGIPQPFRTISMMGDTISLIVNPQHTRIYCISMSSISLFSFEIIPGGRVVYDSFSDPSQTAGRQVVIAPDGGFAYSLHTNMIFQYQVENDGYLHKLDARTLTGLNDYGIIGNDGNLSFVGNTPDSINASGAGGRIVVNRNMRLTE